MHKAQVLFVLFAPIICLFWTLEQVVGSVFVRAYCLKCESSDSKLQYIGHEHLSLYFGLLFSVDI